MPLFTTPQNRQIAFHKTEGKGPGVVFLPGYMSDMEGTKVLDLEKWCKETGRAFLRFDYSGNGQSPGEFTDGCIGDWFTDAREVIKAQTTGQQVIVGSSMGGWIALLLARAIPERLAGMVTIAAAPDFTEEGFWANFDDEVREKLETNGVVHIASDYENPYPVTYRLILDGRENLIFPEPLHLPFPVRFLQGDEDKAVSINTAYRLFAHATGDNIRLNLIKGADHRFSEPENLCLIHQSVMEVIAEKS